MTMEANVLCRLSLIDYGVTPSSSKIEARREGQGFAAFHWNEDFVPEWEVIGKSTAPYSAQEFAKMIMSSGASVDGDAAEQVRVEGETGLRAEMLSRAWARYDTSDVSATELLADQSGASIDVIDGLAGPRLSDVQLGLLSEIGDLTSGGAERDFIKLFSTHQPERRTPSLLQLWAKLERMKRACAEKQARERCERLMPFRPMIQAAAEQLSDQHHRGGPSRRTMLIGYVERYVLENGRMPEGVVEVRVMGVSLSFDFGSLPKLSD